MGRAQLLLICSLCSYSIFSSMARSVPGDVPAESDALEPKFSEICEGMEVELKNCNDRLLEKTEYTSKIEKDLFILKRQLREVRVTCKDAAQVAAVQIADLQSQLDRLLQQLGDKATGPAKDILVILQEFVKIKKLELDIAMETNTEKIAVLVEQLKTSKAQLNDMIVDLSQSQCPAGNSSQIVAEITELQQKIENLKRESGGSEHSAEIAELQKELEEKLKMLENTGDPTAIQVTDVIKDQNELLNLQKAVAELQKTQAEYAALQERLKEKNNLLTDLIGEKEEKGSGNNIDEKIAAVEKDARALEDKLEALNRTLSEKEALENDLLEKKKQLEAKIDALKKDDGDLLSKVLHLQLELQELKIQADGERKAAQFQIEDLQEQLRRKEERMAKLQADVQYLEEKLADRTAECDDLQVEYNAVSKKVEDLIEKLPDQNLKRIMEIVSLSIDIDNIKILMESEKSASQLNELRKQLKDKTDQLNSKKKELADNEPNSAAILNIIEKMEEIQKLQSEVKDVDSFDKINDLQQDLIKLINKLDDSNPAKMVLKNMAMMADVNWLKKLIEATTEQSQKQIADLEGQLKQKEEELENKTAQLVIKGSDVEQLTKEIFDLKKEVKQLNEQIKNVEALSTARVTEMQTQLNQTQQALEEASRSLKEKDAEMAKKVNKITKLIEELKEFKQEAQKKAQESSAKITDLEEKLKNSEVENTKLKADKEKLKQELEEAKKCTDLQKSYNELQEKFENEVSKLNDSFARQVLTIQALSKEVDELQAELNTSTGNTDELRQKLNKKIHELQKSQKELKKTRADSAEILKMLEMSRKLTKQQDQSISEYLAEIDRLEDDVEKMMKKLESAGDEKTKLTIQVIVLKEEQMKLEKLKAEVEREASEKIARLEKEMEEKKKEIAYLKSSGCGANELKEKIAKLERDLNNKEQELSQLKKSTNAEIGKLNTKLAEKTKKLENTGAKLKEKDSLNSDLIQRLADLSEQLKKAISGKNTIDKEAEKQIKDLTKKLEKKDKEVSDLKENNAELTQQVKNTEQQVSELQNSKAALTEEVSRSQKQLAVMEQQVKNGENTIKNLRKELKEKDDKIKAQQGCQDTVAENERLRKLLAEVNARRMQLENVYDENEKLKDQLAKTYARVKELEEAIKTKTKTQITTVSPQLDPETAHRRLLLSNNGRSVRGSEFARYVPDNPERYDTAIAALAKEGYRSGRHYWEIEVQNRACFVVGVAKEYAQRKGEITYTPENGYWGILRKKDGRYQALTNNPTTLHLSGQLTVIGVLLDFNNREITFYNAKAKSVIYTFSDVLPDKLYPYIATCTDQSKHDPPILILDPQSVFWINQS